MVDLAPNDSLHGLIVFYIPPSLIHRQPPMNPPFNLYCIRLYHHTQRPIINLLRLYCEFLPHHGPLHLHLSSHHLRSTSQLHHIPISIDTEARFLVGSLAGFGMSSMSSVWGMLVLVLGTLSLDWVLQLGGKDRDPSYSTTRGHLDCVLILPVLVVIIPYLSLTK